MKAKHFDLLITDAGFRFARKPDATGGLYVVRSGLYAETLDNAATVIATSRLAASSKPLTASRPSLRR